MDPYQALDRIAFLLERNLAESYKVKAFRKAAATVQATAVAELQTLSDAGRLKTLSGVGDATAKVITEALAGSVPVYLEKLEAQPPMELPEDNALRRALRGDCHTHSLWSDGGSPIIEMALTARSLGHEYLVLTDHSPNLKVANGLTVERLLQQWEEVDQVNAVLASEAESGAPVFRVLKGIEVDIMEDGSLDQTEEMLRGLDLVVASVHSNLRAESAVMTERMLAAIANPYTDILGHCTGRKVVGKGRPPSQFDARRVFEACVENNVVVEINSRPERKDPPSALLKLALDIGCNFAIDTDAHAPGQLSWQSIGCERAADAGVPEDRIVNTRDAEGLLATLTR